jgi:hypothetical protein
MTTATIKTETYQKQPKRSGQVNEYSITDDDDLLPTPGSVKRIDRRDVEEVVESLTIITRNKNYNKKSPPDVHTLGGSFWGNDDEEQKENNMGKNNKNKQSKQPKQPKQDIIIAINNKQEQIISRRRIITPAAPGIGLIKTETTRTTRGIKKKNSATTTYTYTNANANTNTNIQQITSGRVLDQDTLRISQIKQNEKHQANHPNIRPWNHAKRFLSSYQP